MIQGHKGFKSIMKMRCMWRSPNLINYIFHFRCCQVCARTFGEACGGPGGFSGTCEPPLQCVSKPPVIGSGICLGKYFYPSISIINIIITLNRSSLMLINLEWITICFLPITYHI